MLLPSNYQLLTLNTTRDKPTNTDEFAKSTTQDGELSSPDIMKEVQNVREMELQKTIDQ